MIIEVDWAYWDGFPIPFYEIKGNIKREHKCYVIKPFIIYTEETVIAIRNLCKPIKL